MDPEKEEIYQPPVEHVALLNGLILESILPLLSFRQYLESRLVCRTWDDAVRRSIPSRVRLDISLCTIVKKGDDKKKSEVEEKLDVMEYLNINELQLGIEGNLHPVIATAFQEIGSLVRKLTIKANLEKNEDFTDFLTLLGSCPQLKHLIWWGVVNESYCQQHENVVFPSVEKLSLGFYRGELQTMGEKAVLWIAGMFPNTRSFSCLPSHREGVIRILLSAWRSESKAFPFLTELSLHLMLHDWSGLTPLEALPQGLKYLNASLDGKKESGSIQEFTEHDCDVMTNILTKHAPTLETLVVNFHNLWKPKVAVVNMGVPGMKNLKSFTVTADFDGDLAIDFKPLRRACFPNLKILDLPYLCVSGVNRLFLQIHADEWDCPRLKELRVKLPKVQIDEEGIGDYEEICREKFPQGELVDLFKNVSRKRLA